LGSFDQIAANGVIIELPESNLESRSHRHADCPGLFADGLALFR
jgi:hypothetical protein